MSTSARENFGGNAVQIQLTVQVFALTDKTADDLAAALSTIGSLKHKVTLYEGAKPLRDKLGNRNSEIPDVVIVELNGHHDETLEDIRQFVEEHGQQTEVFTTFPAEDLKLMPLMMRSGVRDVLPLPIIQPDVVLALSNTLARHRRSLTHARDKKGSVMCFMSVRGGAGGPFLAANIAFLLKAEFGRRTVLMDLDIQYGTTAYDLDIKSDGGVLEALRSPGRIDSVFVESLITTHSSGLDVLPSPSDLSSWDGLTPEALSKLIAVLSTTYDHIVISLPMYMNDLIEQTLALSNPIYLVTQDSISMLRNMNMILQRLPKRGISKNNVEVIHNRVGTTARDVKSYELGKLIGDLPLHKVRSDYTLASRAENEGKAVTELSPRAAMCKDILAIAKHIAEFDSVKKDTKKPTRRWFS